MLHRLILALALVGFLGAVTLPSYTNAQTTQTEEKKDTKKKSAKKKEEKSDTTTTPTETTKTKKAPTAKQLAARKKFSDCAHSWGEHKKETGEKTRKQYNDYMSKCMKKN